MSCEGRSRRSIPSERAARNMPPRLCPVPETSPAGLVRFDPNFGYEVLDPTTHINRKQHRILEWRQDETLAPDRLHVHGAVTATANYQRSNRDDKFGYPAHSGEQHDRPAESDLPEPFEPDFSRDRKYVLQIVVQVENGQSCSLASSVMARNESPAVASPASPQHTVFGDSDRGGGMVPGAPDLTPTARLVASCRRPVQACEQGVARARAPAHLIDGALPGQGVIAHVHSGLTPR